jgi:predicted lactoylglutathione lyase
MLTRRELLAGFATVAFFPLAKGESQTMDQRISIVTLGVKDLARSKRFYVDGFGWKPAFENKEIIFFQTGGMIFALFLRDHLAADFQVDLATFGRAPMALAYNVRAKSEVNPLIQRVVAAGATILKSAREATWGGYSGYFADLDGFAWEVAWNPAWRLAPDGSVEFRESA